MTTMQQLGFQSGERGDVQLGTEAGAGQPPKAALPQSMARSPRKVALPRIDGSGQPPQGERGTPPRQTATAPEEEENATTSSPRIDRRYHHTFGKKNQWLTLLYRKKQVKFTKSLNNF